MARGVELATGYISLVADTAELGDQIKAGLKKGEAHATQTGKVMGKNMRQGIQQELGQSFIPRINPSGGSAENAGQQIGRRVHQGMQSQVSKPFTPRITPNPASADKAGHDLGKRMADSMSRQFQQSMSLVMPASVAGGLAAGTRGATSGLMGLVGGLGVAGAAAGATVASVAAVGLAAGALGAASAKAGIDFTRTLNNMQAVTGATAGQMRAVRDEAMALGRDTEISGASASDAATAMAELAKGGFSVSEAMKAARGTLQLATSAQIDAGTAAEIQANMLNAFSLNADSASRGADVLANVANAASGEITDFAYGMQASATVAHSFGMSMEDTAATLGMLAKAGIKGSDAGTLMKSALLAITDQGNPAQGAIEELGLSLYDASGQFVGMRSLLDQLGVAYKKMTPEAYQAATNVLFGSDAARLAGIAAEKGAKDFDSMRAAVERQGTAAQVAAAQNQGLPGTIERISNTWDDLKLSLFGLLDEPLQMLGNGLQSALASLVEWLNAHKPEIIGFFTDVLNGALAFFEGSIRASAMFNKVLSNSLGLAIEGLGKFASTIGSMLEKLPSWMVPGGTSMATALKEAGQRADDLADNWQNLGGEMDRVADKVASARETLVEHGKAAEEAARFTRSLGDAAAEVTEGQGVVIHDNSPELIQRLKAAGYAVTQLPNSKDISIKAETAQAEADLTAWINKHDGKRMSAQLALSLVDQAGNPVTVDQLGSLFGGGAGSKVSVPAASGPSAPGMVAYDPAKGLFGNAAGRAKGGDITGGTPGKDSVLAALMPGEHVLTTSDVQKMGGQQGVYSFRKALQSGKLPGFEKGGAGSGVSPSQKAAIDFAYAQSGKPYDYGGGGEKGRSFDCSGIASAVWAQMNGMPPGHYFNTESNFAQFGFQKGFKAGALNIGIHHGGGGKNSHMALTLPNGQNVESGGASGGVLYGNGAAGANSGQFEDHWFFEPRDLAAATGGGTNGTGGNSGVDPAWSWLPAGFGGAGSEAAGSGSSSTLGDSGDGRTAGFVPAAAGSTGVAGTSFVSGLLNMGSEAVNGLIDQAASAASSAAGMAIAGGTMGAGMAGGSQAGSAAAQFAIGMATNAAKRGVSYGFQMAGIGADALIEQLTPFGAPRWLGYDYTSFLPQMGVQDAAVTTAEKADSAATQDGGNMKQWSWLPQGFGGQGTQPAPHPGSGMAPGPAPGPGPGPGAPGGPVQPSQMPGAATSLNVQQNDMTKRLGLFDNGGWLPPGGAALNLSGKPEPVFSNQQWDHIKAATSTPLEAAASKGNDYSIKIDNVHVSDVNSLKKELDDKQMLQMMRYAGRP